MNYANLLKVAIKAILAHKSRTILSMLGIIIGVAAVIIMMAIGQGSKQSIRTEISKMGTNLISIRPGANTHGGVRMDPSVMQSLKEEDYESIAHGARLVTRVSPEVTSSGQAIYGSNNTLTTVYGGNLDYLDIKQWKVQSGTCFTKSDIRKATKDCVVGKTIVNELFGENTPASDVIGKTIRFKSTPMRISGVLESKGYNSWGMDQDNVIIAPYTTVMKRLEAQNYLNSVICSAISEEQADDAIKEISQILRVNHKIKEGGEDNFNVFSQQEIMETMSNTMNQVTIILVIAAAFSLLVAGIGIMNIMLVSVTERTKEIGLRMAVGARGIDILLQFLIESILISLTGGIIGVLVGWGVSSLVKAVIHFPAEVPMWSVGVSFLVCTFIGILFGYLPARRAANLDPIEAIRHE